MTQRLKCVKCGKEDMLHKLRRHDDDFNELYMRCGCGEEYSMPYLVPRQALPKRVDPIIFSDKMLEDLVDGPQP